MMDSIRLKVSRSTITACFWFFASVIYFRGIAVMVASIQFYAGEYKGASEGHDFLTGKRPVLGGWFWESW